MWPTGQEVQPPPFSLGSLHHLTLSSKNTRAEPLNTSQQDSRPWRAFLCWPDVFSKPLLWTVRVLKISNSIHLHLSHVLFSSFISISSLCSIREWFVTVSLTEHKHIIKIETEEGHRPLVRVFLMQQIKPVCAGRLCLTDLKPSLSAARTRELLQQIITLCKPHWSDWSWIRGQMGFR